MALPQITCVEDARRLARRRIPKMFYDFVDSGSWTQSTYRANEADFARLAFRQRVGRSITRRDTRTRLLGSDSAMPLAIAPTGLAGFVWPDGEIACARAAERFGVPYTLSIGSVCSLEEVRRHSRATLWMQISLLKDKAYLERLIERARAADCQALVLTMDYHVAGQRHCDIHNGMRLPPRHGPRQLLDMLGAPAWCWGMLKTRNRGFGNVIGHVDGVVDIASFARWHQDQFELDLNWGLVEWLKTRWGGPLLVKGILDPQDARLAVDAGADAIGVSNQGGRQLDGAPSSIASLPAVVAAVGRQVEVLLDGGVRQGQDVLRALALGATGVLTGRATLYGMAAAGEEGVLRVLQLMHAELRSTMAFCGIDHIDAVDGEVLLPPSAARYLTKA
jgi:L-lactate dehydrogenase (cytochrome)